MSMQVLEKISTDGWKVFLNPEGPIEEFRLAGVFRQAQMDVTDAISRHNQDLRFVLFELFLSIGWWLVGPAI